MTYSRAHTSQGRQSRKIVTVKQSPGKTYPVWRRVARAHLPVTTTLNLKLT